MSKKLFIDKVASKIEGSTKVEAEKYVNAMLESVIETVKDDGVLVFVGFGSFTKRERKARKGRNPQTGKIIDIKASSAVTFKAGKMFKEAVNVKVEKEVKKAKRTKKEKK